MTRKIAAAAVAILVVLAVGWYFILWSPQTAKIRTAKATLATAQTSEVALQGQLTALEKLKTSLPLMRRQLGTLDASLPAGSQLDRTISQVSAAADEADVVVVSISPQQSAGSVVAPAGLNEVPVSLTVNGSYFQLMNFIYFLDHMPRLFVVSGINLSPGSSSELAGQINGNIFYTKGAG